MPIDLYHVPGSAPCRSVRLTAAAVGVDLNLIVVDMMSGEHRKPEFLKMNPQHTIPTMNDNGFCLWESRAIMTYLVERYAKNDNLYPKDPKQKALVNQRLFFDMGSLYASFADYYYPSLFAGAPREPAKLEKCNTAFEFLDKFLEGQNYSAGKSLTLADISLIVSVSMFEAMEYDLSKYKNVQRWAAKVKTEIPKYEEINVGGVKAFKELVEKLSKK